MKYIQVDVTLTVEIEGTPGPAEIAKGIDNCLLNNGFSTLGKPNTRIQITDVTIDFNTLCNNMGVTF